MSLGHLSLGIVLGVIVLLLLTVLMKLHLIEENIVKIGNRVLYPSAYNEKE